MLRNLFLLVVLLGAVVTTVALVAGVGLWRAVRSAAATVEADQAYVAQATAAKVAATKPATQPTAPEVTPPAPKPVVQLSRPDAPPPVAVAAESVVLDVATATVVGTGLRVEGNPKTAVNWKQPGDEVRWTVDLAKTGVYEIEAEYACGTAEASGMLFLTLGRSRLAARIDPTGGWDNFRSLVLCRMLVSAGEQSVVLCPAFALADQTIMHLRKVKLTLVQEVDMETPRGRRQRMRF